MFLGYRGDETTPAVDMHSLYREGMLDRTGMCSYRPSGSLRGKART